MKIKVTGMSCGHCKLRVEKALEGIGYKSVVRLENGEVDVQADEDQKSKIIETIEDLGFGAE